MVSNSADDVALYFLQQFARAGANRQSAGILSTFTGMAQSFMGGPIKELLCSMSNFAPAEFSRKGAVIIIDLPLEVVSLQTADNHHRLTRPTFKGAKRPR